MWRIDSIMRKRIRSLKVVSDRKLEALSRHKIKIAVDENIYTVGELLEEKGYNVFFPVSGISDKLIHDWLEENNVKAFFTKNYRDFEDFDIRSYVLYGLKLNRPDDIMTNLIECVMMKDFNGRLNSVKGNFGKPFVRLSNSFVKIIGCKM